MVISQLKKLSYFVLLASILSSCHVKAAQNKAEHIGNLLDLLKSDNYINCKAFLRKHNNNKPIGRNDLKCILDHPKLFSCLSQATDYNQLIVLERFVHNLDVDPFILVGITNKKGEKALALAAKDYTFLKKFCELLFDNGCNDKGDLVGRITEIILETGTDCINKGYTGDCLENLLQLFSETFPCPIAFGSGFSVNLKPFSSAKSTKAFNKVRYFMENYAYKVEKSVREVLGSELYASCQLAAFNETIDLIVTTIDDKFTIKDKKVNLKSGVCESLKNNKRITNLKRMYFSKTNHRYGFYLLYDYHNFSSSLLNREVVDLPTYDMGKLLAGYIRLYAPYALPKVIQGLIYETTYVGFRFPYNRLLSIKNGLSVFEVWSQSKLCLPNSQDILLGAFLTGNTIEAMQVVCEPQSMAYDKEALKNSFRKLTAVLSYNPSKQNLLQKQFAIWIKTTLLNNNSHSAFLLEYNKEKEPPYWFLNHELANASLFISLMEKIQIRNLLLNQTTPDNGDNMFMYMIRCLYPRKKLGTILNWLGQPTSSIPSNLTMVYKNNNGEHLLSIIIKKKLYINSYGQSNLFQQALVLYNKAGGNLSYQTEDGNLCYQLLLEKPSLSLVYDKNHHLVGAFKTLENTCKQLKQQNTFWKMCINPPANFQFEDESYATKLYEKGFIARMKRFFKTLSDHSQRNQLTSVEIMSLYEKCGLPQLNPDGNNKKIKIPHFFKGIFLYAIIGTSTLLDQLKPDGPNKVALLPVLLLAFKQELLGKRIYPKGYEAVPITLLHTAIKNQQKELISYLVTLMVQDPNFYQLLLSFDGKNELYRWMISNLSFELFCEVYNYLFSVIDSGNIVKKEIQKGIVKSILQILKLGKALVSKQKYVVYETTWEEIHQKEKECAEKILVWFTEERKLDLQSIIPKKELKIKLKHTQYFQNGDWTIGKFLRQKYKNEAINESKSNIIKRTSNTLNNYIDISNISNQENKKILRPSNMHNVLQKRRNRANKPKKVIRQNQSYNINYLSSIPEEYSLSDANNDFSNPLTSSTIQNNAQNSESTQCYSNAESYGQQQGKREVPSSNISNWLEREPIIVIGVTIPVILGSIWLLWAKIVTKKKKKLARKVQSRNEKEVTSESDI